MTTDVVTEDRLLEHYTSAQLRARGLGEDQRDTVRAELDTAKAWQGRLGRVGGEYEYLRALICAGIATRDEMDWIADIAS